MDIVEKNIKNAINVLSAVNITHRPHINAHKSATLARLQQQLGCRGITCAKPGEAEVMADGGIKDILLAYPLIGADKLEHYRALLMRKDLNIRTIINSIPGAQKLSDLGQSLGLRLPVLIELDGGTHRGGLPNGAKLAAFGKAVKKMPGLRIEGVEYYCDDIYTCTTKEDIRQRTQRERDEILEAAKTLNSLGLDISILSGGSSFSMFFPEEIAGLTEVRAGNYIFNDCTRLGLGLITIDDCALRVCCTVIARPDSDTAIIDAGSKTLTCGAVHRSEGYGHIVEAPNAIIYKLNEEHGFVKQEGGIDWEVGQTISIIPNHACAVPNLCDEIYAMRLYKGMGTVYDCTIPVDARGKNR